MGGNGEFEGVGGVVELGELDDLESVISNSVQRVFAVTISSERATIEETRDNVIDVLVLATEFSFFELSDELLLSDWTNFLV